MKTLTATLFVSAIGLAVAFAAPAEAAGKTKHKKQTASHSAKHRHAAVSVRPAYWGTDVVRAGPLYNGADYLGDDPDPNVRAFIIKDLSGRYGGSY